MMRDIQKHQPDLYRGLRFCLSCGNGSTVCDRGSGQNLRCVWSWLLSSVTEIRILDPNGLVIIISQSGETADSLAALRECQRAGYAARWQLSMWSVPPLPERRINVFYTLAGPEISVATTKAYSTQLIASYVLAYPVGTGPRRDLQRSSMQELHHGTDRHIPDKIGKILEDKGADSVVCRQAGQCKGYLFHRKRASIMPSAWKAALR